jgi:hypothetical protein
MAAAMVPAWGTISISTSGSSGDRLAGIRVSAMLLGLLEIEQAAR